MCQARVVENDIKVCSKCWTWSYISLVCEANCTFSSFSYWNKCLFIVLK